MCVGETRAAGTEGQRRETLKGEIGRFRLWGMGCWPTCHRSARVSQP